MCRNGHESDLVVVGARLYFFIWRTNMLIADNWMWAQDSEGGFKPKDRLNSWPSEKLVDELADSVSTYLGKGDLSSVDFNSFNQLVLDFDPRALHMYNSIIDLAELFILFHEYQHVRDMPSLLPPNIQLLQRPSLPQERAANWNREQMTDMESAMILFISATRQMMDIGLNLPKAKMTAAGLVFSGADAALHTLKVLEKVRYGEISQKEAETGFEFRGHPPAQLRRAALSQLCRYLCLTSMDESAWMIVSSSIASLALTRDKLFDAFFTSRPSFVAGIRFQGSF
jgi:hypothetical protein